MLFLYIFTGSRVKDYGHFPNCSVGSEDNIRDRGREMLANRPVPVGAILRRHDHENALEGLKLRKCPRCRQRNMKENRNNHMKCWACKSEFCYQCVKLVTNPVSIHYTGSKVCQQHSDD